jgi:hypothetical protein
MEQSLEIALALGAPLLSAPLPPETVTSWSEVQAQLGAATSHAKRLNVTIAVRNMPHTFAASTHDMKRVSKEADSAWLRYGPEFTAFDAGSEPQSVLPKTVLVWHELCELSAIEPIARLLAAYRGFVALDDSQGAAKADSTVAALRAWRTAVQ